MKVEDILTVLPVYDQYIFQDGLAVCDAEIFNALECGIKNHLYGFTP